MAGSRIPCPQCGTMNYPQDAQCLGCGCRFAPRPTASAPVAPPQFAPDEMCPRCYGVLLPASQFDARNTVGGVDSGGQMGYVGGVGSPGMAARELSGVLWLLDTLANLLVGGIIAKNFQRRLQTALKEAPHSLCCPSCRSIVRR